MNRLIYLCLISFQFLIACTPIKGEAPLQSQSLSQKIEINQLSVQEQQDQVTSEYLTPTIYYRPIIHSDQTVCAFSDIQEVLDPNGAPLLRLCQEDYNRCLLQGSCIVEDRTGRYVLNYQFEKDDQYYFTEGTSDNCPYGYGVQNICLDPFYSVAADLHFFKAGDVIYVGKLKGLVMADGKIHDGYLIVRDDGGRIIGNNRFDFFTGEMNYIDRKNPFTRIGLADRHNQFSYQKITDPAVIEQVHKNRQYPSIPK